MSATKTKTGGRQKGTPNKATAARSAPPAPDLSPATRAPAREEPQFPAYRLVKTDTLVPFANNARTHSPAQIDKITASLREFGFTNPVLTDGKHGIVAGHGRVLAAKKLGLAVVPTIELSHLTAAQRRAYVIADNRLALDAGWDEELLRLELGELRDDGFDLALTGFDGLELDKLFGPTEGNTDPDDVPEIQAEVVSRLGDVWLLGAKVTCPKCGKVQAPRARS